jgi:hypothetical protein
MQLHVPFELHKPLPEQTDPENKGHGMVQARPRNCSTQKHTAFCNVASLGSKHLPVEIVNMHTDVCPFACNSSSFVTSIVAWARLGPRASIFAVGPNQVRRTHAVTSFTNTSIAYCTILKTTLTTATKCENNAHQSGCSKISCDATCHFMR